MNLKKIIKPAVLQANAYHIPKAEGLIKLDAMENPYAWSEEIKNQWAEYLKQANLNRYPDADASNVRQQLKSSLNLSDNIDILFGNGSDELIQIILLALNKEFNSVLAVEPSFVMYRLLSELLELNFSGVLLNGDFSLNLSSVKVSIEQQQPGVIFIAWPNNPTGNCFGEDELEQIFNIAPGLVVVDEAYHVFAQKTMMSYLEKYPNVLLMRTFSKLGLAGLRLGMLFGRKEWISQFNKIRLPYNIGTLNQLSASFILDNIEILEQQAMQIRKDRQTMFTALTAINGIQAWPSNANFILFRVEDKPADEIHAALLDNKILIKNLHGSQALLKNCLRVTVGTAEENEKFISCLKAIISS